jgi:aminoglycoside 6-adenylyltransferase
MNDTIKNVCQSVTAADDIKAAIIVGSQARNYFSADQYSDLDIIIITTNPEFYLISDDWLKTISDFHISFMEHSLFNAKERRVLFDDGTDVDFMILSLEQSSSIKNNEEHGIIFQRGFKVIKDEINITDDLVSLQKHMRSSKQNKLLSQEAFHHAVNDFWFHSVWASKKMMRGELLTAKSCLDNYMKRIVLTFIENDTLLHHPSRDTWYNGRFIEKWADDWIIEKLSHCYGQYKKADMMKGLYATMELFALLAEHIAEQKSYLYPKACENQAYKIINRLLKQE